MVVPRFRRRTLGAVRDGWRRPLSAPRPPDADCARELKKRTLTNLYNARSRLARPIRLPTKGPSTVVSPSSLRPSSMKTLWRLRDVDNDQDVVHPPKRHILSPLASLLIPGNCRPWRILALERLTTGKQRDRVYAYKGYLALLTGDTE